MALSAALHHSRGVGFEQHNAPRGPTTASVMEGEVREVYEVLREQKPPLPRMRPAPLPEVAGPKGRLVAPACPLGGVMVQEAAHDDATVSNLLSQTLLAEQEAKEVEVLEAKLADCEHRLLMSVREVTISGISSGGLRRRSSAGHGSSGRLKRRRRRRGGRRRGRK